RSGRSAILELRQDRGENVVQSQKVEVGSRRRSDNADVSMLGELGLVRSDVIVAVSKNDQLRCRVSKRSFRYIQDMLITKREPERHQCGILLLHRFREKPQQVIVDPFHKGLMEFSEVRHNQKMFTEVLRNLRWICLFGWCERLNSAGVVYEA